MNYCTQIVNFMSTDSDRIVNFCASFHQFWSLPFQVVVSLALLYQQVCNFLLLSSMYSPRIVIELVLNVHWLVYICMYIGRSGFPWWFGFLHLADTCESLAGRKDWQAKYSYDGAERPESKSE